jgi:hypothetical protein
MRSKWHSSLWPKTALIGSSTPVRFTYMYRVIREKLSGFDSFASPDFGGLLQPHRIEVDS